MPGKHRRSRTRRAPRSRRDRTPRRHLGGRARKHNPPFYTGPVVSREHQSADMPIEPHPNCRSVASAYADARRRIKHVQPGQRVHWRSGKRYERR